MRLPGHMWFLECSGWLPRCGGCQSFLDSCQDVVMQLLVNSGWLSECCGMQVLNCSG